MSLRETADGVELDVRVVPNARRPELTLDERGYRLKIDAPPVDGAANARVVRFFAKRVFGIAKGRVRIVRGERSREKTLSIELSLAEAKAALAAVLSE